MKFKKMMTLLLATVLGLTLVACGDKESGGEEKTQTGGDQPAVTGEIVVWVGKESTAFYQTALDEYIVKYNESHDTAFPATFTVAGVDLSAVADNYLGDTAAGADLFVCPHDNLGKLIAGDSPSIEKVSNQALLEQIVATNPAEFLNVCNLSAGDGSDAAFYGVPLIAQSLVLYYDSALFEGKEEKLTTWEGVAEVATEAGRWATGYLGTDGYNYSHWLLAQPESDDAIATFGDKGTLKIYGDGLASNCYSWGDDQVAIAKYAQRFTKNYMGGVVTSEDGWKSDLGASRIATVVGGAWSLADIINNLGEDGYGVTVLPTFTLTADDAYGAATAGMTFRSGSFYDCKVMCKKKGSKFAAYLDDIILYLSSNAIQEQSYKQCANLPASTQVDLGNNPLANAQIKQAELASIPQPFGYAATYNASYYSKGGPEIYVAISQAQNNTPDPDDASVNVNYGEEANIIRGLQNMAYIWAKNKALAPSSSKTAAERLAEFVASVEANLNK